MASDGRALEGWPTEPLIDVPGPDPFPWDRFGAMIRRTPRYLHLAWLLAGEPSVPKSRRAGVVAAAAYLASPVDLVPGFIPVVGQLDDMAIAMLALRAALRSLDEPTRTRVLAESNLVREDLDADIATIGATAGWLIRRGVRVSARLMRLAAIAGLAIGRVGVRVGIAAGRRGVRVGILGRADRDRRRRDGRAGRCRCRCDGRSDRPRGRVGGRRSGGPRRRAWRRLRRSRCRAHRRRGRRGPSIRQRETRPLGCGRAFRASLMRSRSRPCVSSRLWFVRTTTLIF